MRRLYLGPADIVCAVQYLSVQVGDIHDIELHQADGADSSGREVEGDRRAKSARADEQDAGSAQPELAVYADLRQRQVPAVARDFVGREAGRICVTGVRRWHHGFSGSELRCWAHRPVSAYR